MSREILEIGRENEHPRRPVRRATEETAAEEQEFNAWLADNGGMIRKPAKAADIPGCDLEDVARELRLNARDVLSRGLYDPGRGVKLSTFMYPALSARVREPYRNAVCEGREGKTRPQSPGQNTDDRDPCETLSPGEDSVEETAAYPGTPAALDRALAKLPLGTRYFAEQTLAGHTRREAAVRSGRSQAAAAYRIGIFRHAVRQEPGGEDPR